MCEQQRGAIGDGHIKRFILSRRLITFLFKEFSKMVRCEFVETTESSSILNKTCISYGVFLEKKTINFYTCFVGKS